MKRASRDKRKGRLDQAGEAKARVQLDRVRRSGRLTHRQSRPPRAPHSPDALEGLFLRRRGRDGLFETSSSSRLISLTHLKNRMVRRAGP